MDIVCIFAVFAQTSFRQPVGSEHSCSHWPCNSLRVARFDIAQHVCRRLDSKRPNLLQCRFHFPASLPKQSFIFRLVSVSQCAGRVGIVSVAFD